MPKVPTTLWRQQRLALEWWATDKPTQWRIIIGIDTRNAMGVRGQRQHLLQSHSRREDVRRTSEQSLIIHDSSVAWRAPIATRGRVGAEKEAGMVRKQGRGGQLPNGNLPGSEPGG